MDVIEVQHATSHELEGHSVAIDQCPICRDPDGWLRKQYNSWTQDCPARGPGLSHAHWDQCQGAHPGSGRQHDRWTCCHCEHHIGS